MERIITSWEELDSPEIIYKCIRLREFDMGEDFLDQYETIVKETPFATYLYGRGIITREQLNAFMNERISSTNDLLVGYEEPYAVIPYGQATEEGEFKKYHLLSEYIYSIDTLRRRLFRVLSTYNDYRRPIGEDEEIFEVKLDNSYFESDKERRFGSVHDEWLWVIENSVKDVNKLLKERER